MMKDDEAKCSLDLMCQMIALAVMISSISTALIASGLISSSWRDESVFEGHAEYYLDHDHNRQWRWKSTVKDK